MICAVSDARAYLESKGLYVSGRTPNSLWIATAVHDAGEGVLMSNEACSLIANADGWVAIFPGEGLSTYELPGTLEELVGTIVAVYEKHRQSGGVFANAFRQVVRDPERYVIGRSLVRV